MSDTPRTDAFENEHPLTWFDEKGGYHRSAHEWREHARQLELALSKGNAWASPDERKPKHREMVLGYWPGSTHCPASFESLTFEEDEGREYWVNVFGAPVDEPTHWMPLPSAPEAK